MALRALARSCRVSARSLLHTADQPSWQLRNSGADSFCYLVPISIEVRIPFSTNANVDMKRKAQLNALAYRAKQRGFLELDLIVGGWAEANLPSLSAEELRDFAVVLDQENPELFKWLTGQLTPPPEMAANLAFERLRAHAAKHLEKHSQKATRAGLGKDWVRGWGDSGDPSKKASLPSSGNQQ